jgi:hypothetical protein
MQIRIGLIPLITSTFVFFPWDYLATLPSQYLCFYQSNYIIWQYACKITVFISFKVHKQCAILFAMLLIIALAINSKSHSM